MERSDHSGTVRRRYFEIAQALLLAITAGELAPGARLPADREIASQHGVSRATAREALLALEVLGAVEIQHGNGVFVRGAIPQGAQGDRFSGIDAHPYELIEARMHIEPVTIALVAGSISSTTLEILTTELAEAEDLSDDDAQLERYVEINFRFHAVLALECKNHVIRGITSELINTELHPLWSLINQQASRTQAARARQLHEHKMILSALRTGDPDTARAEMLKHLRAISQSLFPHQS
jgi:GntR family uxuAB operon transcriptional repressor